MKSKLTWNDGMDVGAQLKVSKQIVDRLEELKVIEKSILTKANQDEDKKRRFYYKLYVILIVVPSVFLDHIIWIPLLFLLFFIHVNRKFTEPEGLYEQRFKFLVDMLLNAFGKMMLIDPVDEKVRNVFIKKFVRKHLLFDDIKMGDVFDVTRSTKSVWPSESPFTENRIVLRRRKTVICVTQFLPTNVSSIHCGREFMQTPTEL
jgi:hypothetical protein